MIHPLPPDLRFPDPERADPSGCVAWGGDLAPDRLLLAYRSGIFPWYGPGEPILWWSPDPRMVLPVSALHVPRSLAKRIRQRRYRITMDQDFDQVIERCAGSPRPGQGGTWIVPAMIRAYQALHRLGFAHSVEAWDEAGQLVGGLYGVAVGRLFSGESMFADAPDASKVAFVHLVRQLDRWGFPWVDSQVHTEHLARFGALEVSRRAYLAQALPLARKSDQPGPWSFDADFVCDG